MRLGCNGLSSDSWDRFMVNRINSLTDVVLRNLEAATIVELYVNWMEEETARLSGHLNTIVFPNCNFGVGAFLLCVSAPNVASPFRGLDLYPRDLALDRLNALRLRQISRIYPPTLLLADQGMQSWTCYQQGVTLQWPPLAYLDFVGGDGQCREVILHQHVAPTRQELRVVFVIRREHLRQSHRHCHCREAISDSGAIMSGRARPTNTRLGLCTRRTPILHSRCRVPSTLSDFAGSNENMRLPITCMQVSVHQGSAGGRCKRHHLAAHTQAR